MTSRPDFPRGLNLGPLLQWVIANGIGRERSTQPGLSRWTQADLAEHLGRDERHLRRWLKDEVTISDDYLDLLVGELLGRPPSWPELAGELRAARDRTGRLLRGESPASSTTVDNLPPPNPDFVGREGALAELRRLLATDGTAAITQARAITGLGGVGKTQTALAYAWRHRADYRLVWWLRAEERTALAADYAGLAEPLGLDPATPEQAKLLAAVRARLEERADWLLVFDNAEDPALLLDHLPRQARGHVLVTSRRTDWRRVARPVPLDVPPAEEALALLAGGAEEGAALAGDERAQAAALAEELGHLPLALAQARAYLDETRIGTAAYRRHLAESRADLLARGRPSPDYPLPVALTWQASIEAAARDEPAARPLLELLSFFAPDAIPRTLLAADPEALPEALSNPLDREDAIGALARYSLVRAEVETLTVHRLVQAVTRDHLSTEAAAERAGCAVHLVWAAWPGTAWRNPEVWPVIAPLLPHAVSATEAAEVSEAEPEASAAVLDYAATYLHARGTYAEALPLFQRALAIGEKALGPDHPDLSSRLNNLALLYRDLGRHAEALPLHERDLAISEKTLGPDHPDLAVPLNNLAGLYRDTGRHAEALPLYQRAIAITERVVDPEHPDLAPRLNNFANFYIDIGRHAEALPLLQRAITITEKARGPEHPDLATQLSNLGKIYLATGRHTEALPLLGRALPIARKAFGPDHPHVGLLLHNHAVLLATAGREAEARSDLERALAILEPKLGPDHPWTVAARSALADLALEPSSGPTP